VQASVVEGVLRVRIPSSMSRAEEEHWVDVMQERIERQLRSDDIDLVARGRELANELNLSVPKRITFSDRQKQRWGSCTPGTGSVRISSRAASFPGWVLDYIIVHELAHLEAHLEVPDHSPAFWRLVQRYQLAERARGFLIAKNLGEN